MNRTSKYRSVVAAVAVAAAAAPALAIDLPLPNGSFETPGPASNTFGNIVNWTYNGVLAPTFSAGVFTTYDGFNPSNGARMALITNAGASINVQLRNATPMLLQNMPFLNFNFAFLTNDATSTALANRDQFVVIIDYFADAAATTQTGTQSFVINTGTLVAGGAVPPAPNPFTGTPNRTQNPFGNPSGLNIATLSMSYNATSQYALVTFYLDNLGTSGSGVVSGVLLDNVYINPEPGTLALFGLGAVGLAGLVWRRRRARLALTA